MKRFGTPWRAAVLIAGSAVAAATLEAVRLPAGLLLGPMLVAIGMAARGWGVTIPPLAFRGGQAVVGVLIATSITRDLMGQVARQPWLFAGVTAATLGASMLLGWALDRARLLPPRVAVWGAMPGAATSMVLMARDAGADWRLVATMSYARVVCVAGIASVLAGLIAGSGGHHGPPQGWFPPLDPTGLVETLAVAALGAWGGGRLGLPAGALNGPLALGVMLNAAGIGHVQLPGWLLAASYAAVGWRVGLAFTPEIVRVAARALPRILLSTGLLIGFCAALAWLLARATGRDLLTSYLATSPGGADSVAIIAQAAPVDVPFVMAMQVLRFLAVLLAGPWLARMLARRRA